jgi:hypothetical protein
MAENADVVKATVTPSGLSTELDFNQKVNAVDSALRDRAAAQKRIKTAWAGVVRVLVKYDMKKPTRRLHVDTAEGLVDDVKVYKPQDKRLEDKDAVKFAKAHSYSLRRTVEDITLSKAIDEKFPGFSDWVKDINELYNLAHTERELDEEATKKAKDELAKAVEKYTDAVEAYDETVDSVANVKEYVSVVKDIAEISAIAKGAMPNQS